MFNVIEKTKPKEEFKLEIGDVVVTDKGKLLTVCDGWGQYYFIRLKDGFIVALDEDGAYKTHYRKKYKIGGNLIESELEYERYQIQGIISAKEVEITLEIKS